MVLKAVVGNSEYLGYNESPSISDVSGIFTDVLRHNQKSGKVEWRVLVVDKFSIKILSSTIKMHQLSAEGITCKLVYSIFPIFHK